MSDFKAKMQKIRYRLRLRPRSRWASLQRFPRPPSCIHGGLLLMGRRRKGRGGKREGNEMEEEEKKRGSDGRESASPPSNILAQNRPCNVRCKCPTFLLSSRRHCSQTFLPFIFSLTHSLAPSLSLDVQRRVRDWVRLFADSRLRRSRGALPSLGRN